MCINYNLICSLVPYKNKFALGYSDTNSLIINNKEDLAYFKKVTSFKQNESDINIVVMGRKTWESLNCKPLPNRINVILTNDKTKHYTFIKSLSCAEMGNLTHFCTDFKGLEDILSLTKDTLMVDHKKEIYTRHINVYVIGGSEIYKLFYYHNIYITLYNKFDFTKIPDVFFDINTITNIFKLEEISNVKEYNNTKYINVKYTNSMSNLENEYFDVFSNLPQLIYAKDGFEYNYISLIQNILKNGVKKTDRTGTGTISLFGQSLKIDISKTIPLLTTKYMNWRNIIEELLWFLRGDTDVNILNSKGIKIWDGNTTREFLDKNNLQHIPEKTIGASYSWQWRNFGAAYNPVYKDTSKNKCKEGFDQINYILNLLKTEPTSRRMVLSGWNPSMLKDMALPPCHLMAIFNVVDTKLNCHLVMRSTDVGLGLPYNLFSYSVLVYILAKKANLQPGELYYTGTDVHIYTNHIQSLENQCKETIKTQPVLILDESIKHKDFSEITINDFDLFGYYSGKFLKMDMAI